MSIIVGDDVRQACVAAFDNPDLAKCWLLMILHEMTPANFLKAVKFVTHNKIDVVDHARDMIRRCMGTPV